MRAVTDLFTDHGLDTLVGDDPDDVVSEGLPDCDSRVEDWRGIGRLPLAVSAVSSSVPV